LSYCERWLAAIEPLMANAGMLTSEEIDPGLNSIAKRGNAAATRALCGARAVDCSDLQCW